MKQDEAFSRETQRNVAGLSRDKDAQALSRIWLRITHQLKYDYNFRWLGRPVFQLPQDIIAMQEIIFEVKPDLIVETGIAHGGSLIFYASMLELVAACGGPDGQVLGIDIDIRAHNRKAIEEHPMFKRISMIEGSSVALETITEAYKRAKDKKNVMVCLDSYHTHDHVLAELNAYAPLTSVGSYCVVFDSAIEDLPSDFFPDRPWGKGNNPKTAVKEFLKNHKEFKIDKSVEHKLLITNVPDGYLRRIR